MDNDHIITTTNENPEWYLSQPEFVPVTEIDRSLVHTLLPMVYLTTTDSDLYIAMATRLDSSEVVGAAALSRVVTTTKPASLPYYAFVKPEYRLRGIGRMLLKATEAQTLTWNKKALSAWYKVRPASEDSRIWGALGFRCQPGKVSHYALDLSAFLEYVEPLYNNLIEHNRFPADYNIIPLSKASVGQIIQLQVEFIGGKAGYLDRRLRGHGQYPFNLALSQVLMVGRNIGGYILARFNHAHELIVESRVVSPAYRGKWVNLMLMRSAALNAVKQGLTKIHFVAGILQPDTQKLARRLSPNSAYKTDVYLKQL